MRAEALYQLAAARGLDLVAAAQQQTDDSKAKPTTKTRRAYGHFTQQLLEPPVNMVRGAGSGTHKQREWTVAELAQAAAGIPPIYFKAAVYAFAGNRDNYTELMNAIYGEGARQAHIENWPMQCKDLHQIDRPYLRHLAKLVLDEDASPHPFKIGGDELYAIYLHIDVRTWESLRPRYEFMRGRWLDWLESAARMMQPRLARDDDHPHED